MVLAIIPLLVLGFISPVFWLALAGYLIYIFASRETRRNGAIESRIRKMVLAGQNYATFSELYFEAAHAYAIAKGARAAEPNAASAHILVNGRKYFATFVRIGNGGTDIILSDSDELTKRIDAEMTRAVSAPVSVPEPAPVPLPEPREQASKSVLDELDNLVGSIAADQFVTEYMESVDHVELSDLNEKPSWLGDSDVVKSFLYYLAGESPGAGIAETYTMLVMHQKDLCALVLSCVARAESEGRDFSAQKQIGLAFIKHAWDRLDEERQEKFRAMPVSALDLDAVSTF